VRCFQELSATAEWRRACVVGLRVSCQLAAVPNTRAPSPASPTRPRLAPNPTLCSLSADLPGYNTAVFLMMPCPLGTYDVGDCGELAWHARSTSCWQRPPTASSCLASLQRPIPRDMGDHPLNQTNCAICVSPPPTNRSDGLPCRRVPRWPHLHNVPFPLQQLHVGHGVYGLSARHGLASQRHLL
jgi:hypothetical protein